MASFHWRNSFGLVLRFILESTYAYQDGPDQKLRYRRSSNGEGDTGGWSGGANLVISDSGMPGEYVDLQAHRIRPTLVHLAGGGSPTVKYLRSADYSGDDAADWSGGTAFDVDSGAAPFGEWLAVAEINPGYSTSHFVMVYRNESGGNLKLATYISPAIP